MTEIKSHPYSMDGVQLIIIINTHEIHYKYHDDDSLGEVAIVTTLVGVMTKAWEAMAATLRGPWRLPWGAAAAATLGEGAVAE